MNHTERESKVGHSWAGVLIFYSTHDPEPRTVYPLSVWVPFTWFLGCTDPGLAIILPTRWHLGRSWSFMRTLARLGSDPGTLGL